MHRREQKSLTLGAFLLLGIGALAGCGKSAPAPDAASAAAAALATITVGAQATPDEVMLDGVVEAVDQATLSAQTAGRVAEVLADIDDRVQAGQLLMRLRASEQVAGLGQARAALQAAEARDAQARAQHDRIRDMYERKVVARATYDDAVAARDSAAASLAAARAAIASAQEGVAYTELRAPFAGVVTARRVQVGEAVAPGVPLLSVASLDSMRVVAEVPQSVAASVQGARNANVYVGQQRIAAAKITLYPSAEPQSGTFRARFELPGGAPRLAPGTYAKVGLVVGEAHRTLVPVAAVVERSELRAVYVVTPEGRVVLRQVRLGRRVGDQLEVIAGLADGEKIATDPAAAGLVARSGTGPRT
jgi:RND family efflux transporter MFP subunit